MLEGWSKTAGAFGRCLGRDAGALLNKINKISALMGEIPRFSHHVRTQPEVTSYKPGRGSSSEGSHAGALILDFQFPDCEK